MYSVNDCVWWLQYATIWCIALVFLSIVIPWFILCLKFCPNTFLMYSFSKSSVDFIKLFLNLSLINVQIFWVSFLSCLLHHCFQDGYLQAEKCFQNFNIKRSKHFHYFSINIRKNENYISCIVLNPEGFSDIQANLFYKIIWVNCLQKAKANFNLPDSSSLMGWEVIQRDFYG